MSPVTKPLIFTILVLVSYVIAGGLMFISIFASDSPSASSTATANGLFYTCIWYFVLSIIALIICWTSRSIMYSLIPIILIIPIYFVIYNSSIKATTKQNQEYAVAEQAQKVAQQATIASLSKDFTCTDGSFIHIDAGGFLTHYTPATNPADTGSDIALLSDSKTQYTVLIRSADVKTMIDTCKNAQGKSISQLYSEEYTASKYVPKVFPITQAEALQLVRDIPDITNPENIAIINYVYHDEYSNRDMLVAQNKIDNYKYYVFTDNGQIIYSLDSN